MASGKGQHIVLTYTRVGATMITPAQRASAFSSSQYQTHQLGHVGCDGVHSAPVPVVSIQDLLFLLISECSPPREGVASQKEDHSDTNKLSYNHGYFKPEGSSGCPQRVKNTQLSCILTEQSMWHSLSLSLPSCEVLVAATWRTQVTQPGRITLCYIAQIKFVRI